jgi:hypothetical protein
LISNNKKESSKFFKKVENKNYFIEKKDTKSIINSLESQSLKLSLVYSNSVLPINHLNYTLYQQRNTELWVEYGEGKITKDELNSQRFFYPLQAVGVKDEAIAEQFSRYFFAIIPTKSVLMPHAKEVLEYLAPKYNLYILPNASYVIAIHETHWKGYRGYISPPNIPVPHTHAASADFLWE